MLMSKEPKIFFNGLKILTAIHESSDQKEKREIAEQVLSMLCKLIPSYVKRSGEEYELNKTKMDASIKEGKHPLDLKSTLASAKQGAAVSNPGSNVAVPLNEQPTGIVMTAPPPSSEEDDDIKVISVEDQESTGEEELVAQAKQIAADTVEDENSGEAGGPESATPAEKIESDASKQESGESLEFEKAEIDEYGDDEWIGASDFKDTIDEKLLFDKEGKASKELAAGLDLINPVEREQAIDMNYSSAKGYHDPYTKSRFQPPAEAMMPPVEAMPEQSLPASSGKALTKNASEMSGQECGFGDGTIVETDGTVYVCPGCNTPFHEGCGQIVLEVQHGRCPVCDASWI